MQQLVRACSKAVRAVGAASNEQSAAGGAASRFQEAASRFQEAILKGLPAMAGQLLNSAAGHRLNAAQDVLLVFRE